MPRFPFAALALLAMASVAGAVPPVLSYVFPAGGRRGETVQLRVGGLFLHDRSQLEIDGLKFSASLKPMPRLWFEGPILPLPESQQSEDYPVDRAASLAIPKDAPRGPHRARVWTSQGAGAGPAFVVGDLPEVVEAEIDGDPIAVPVTLPVTANGRVFPREDIDLWSFAAKKGESITAFAVVSEIRSSVVPLLEIVDDKGRVVAEQSPRSGLGQDATVRFTAPVDGRYAVRVRDAKNAGGPAHVYRLTITTGPVVDRVFPLGGRRGSRVRLEASGQGLPANGFDIAIPADAPATWHSNIASANPVALDVDDAPEFLDPTMAVTVPATLNGRLAKSDGADEWRFALKKGGIYEFVVFARSLGSPLCATVAIEDASGKIVARGESADPATDPKVLFTAPNDGTYLVRVGERFRRRAGPDFTYRLKVRDAKTPSPDVRLTVANDLAIVPRGGTAKLKLAVERIGGFVGPIELAADGWPAGLSMAKTTIGEKQNTVDLVISATADAKIVPAQVAIVGRSKLGSHRVSFNGADRLFAIPAVPTPFKFTGDYTMGNAPRGQPYARKYKIERNGYDGPITIALADRQIRHLQGADGDPLPLNPDATEFLYAARLPAWIETGRTCRVTLMAVGRVRDADGTEHAVAYTSTEQNHQMIVVPEPGRLDVELGDDVVVAAPGRTLRVPFRVVRAKGLAGAAKVELVLPAHWRGVTAAAIDLPADREHGELAVQFAAGEPGPFNRPATLRATVADAVAEAKLEILPPR